MLASACVDVRLRHGRACAGGRRRVGPCGAEWTGIDYGRGHARGGATHRRAAMPMWRRARRRMLLRGQAQGVGAAVSQFGLACLQDAGPGHLAQHISGVASGSRLEVAGRDCLRQGVDLGDQRSTVLRAAAGRRRRRPSARRSCWDSRPAPRYCNRACRRAGCAARLSPQRRLGPLRVHRPLRVTDVTGWTAAVDGAGRATSLPRLIASCDPSSSPTAASPSPCPPTSSPPPGPPAARRESRGVACRCNMKMSC